MDAEAWASGKWLAIHRAVGVDAGKVVGEEAETLMLGWMMQDQGCVLKTEAPPQRTYHLNLPSKMSHELLGRSVQEFYSFPFFPTGQHIFACVVINRYLSVYF